MFSLREAYRDYESRQRKDVTFWFWRDIGINFIRRVVGPAATHILEMASGAVSRRFAYLQKRWWERDVCLRSATVTATGKQPSESVKQTRADPGGGPAPKCCCLELAHTSQTWLFCTHQGSVDQMFAEEP